MSELDELTKIVLTLAQKVDNLVDITTPKRCDKTVDELFEEFLSYKRSLNRINDKTYSDYRDKYKYIHNSIGQYSVSTLSSETLEKVFNSIEYGRTRQKIFSIFKSCLDYAVRKRYISENPCLFVEVADYEEKIRLPLSPVEQRRFLKVVSKYPTGLLFRVYLETGIRKEEITKITLCNYGKQNPYIHVLGTKTVSSVRDVPITVSLSEALKKFFDNGGKFSVYNVSRRMKRICEKAKISTEYTTHCLRHTFATNCYYKNVPIERISYWLGHGSVKITEHYIHKLLGLSEGDNKLIDKVNKNLI